MKNLFYSEGEKLAFWVSGIDVQTSSVEGILEYLIKHKKEASKILGAEYSELKTIVINESQQYSGMRVFFAKVEVAPKGSFAFGKEYDWTMMRVLKE